MTWRRETFERLALPLQNDLYRFACSITRSEADAMDLLQETFLRAYRGFRSFTPGSNFKAWIVRILKNTHIEMRRKKRQEPLTPEAEAALVREGPANDELTFPQVMEGEVERAMTKMDPSSRAILLMAYVYGFLYREIAETLDIPIGTVMSRIHRARKRLKEIIHEDRLLREKARSTAGS